MLFPVNPEKEKALLERMVRSNIKEGDILERFVRSGGRGGQNVNKVATCVYLKHLPSGIEVKCQQERSQGLNRFLARRMLLEKIEAAASGVASLRQQKIEKLRRQKRRRSRRAKDKMLEQKHKNSEKKQLRHSVITIE